jgi:hypothetical protein
VTPQTTMGTSTVPETSPVTTKAPLGGLVVLAGIGAAFLVFLVKKQ